MKIHRAVLFLGCGLFAACATTGPASISKSSSPATIQERVTSAGQDTWGGPMLFRAGDEEVGYAARTIGATYTVDSGATVLWVWYYAFRPGLGGAYIQSDPVDMRVALAPSGHYELRARTGAHRRVQAHADMGTVAFSLVDVSTGKTVAATPEVLLWVGPSRLASSEFKVSPRMRGALAAARDCCAALKDLPYAPLPSSGDHETSIDSNSPAYTFGTGKSYFLAYRLPRTGAGTSIVVKSWLDRTVFFPRLLLLDESFSPIRRVGPPEVHYVPAGRVEPAHYEADCSIRPGDPARYLVILTTDLDLTSVLELSSNVTFNGSAEAGAQNLPPVAAGRSGGADMRIGAVDKTADLPPDSRSAGIAALTFPGATVAHDFAPMGRLSLAVSTGQ